jgi:hypothetical protein
MTSTPETASTFSSSVEARKAQLIERCQSLGELSVWPGRAKLDSVAWLENFRPAELPLALVLLKAVLFFNSRMLDRLFLATIGKLRRFAAQLSTEIYQRRESWEIFRQSITITMMTGEIPSLADSGYIYLRCARDLAHITEDRIVSPEKALDRVRANPNLPVVFVDDFVGSGDQFVKTWRRDYGNGKAFSLLNQTSSPRFYCCPLFCTWAAAERIRKECPNVILVPGHLLEERYSVLSSDFFVQHSIPQFSRAIMDVSLRAGIKANVAYGYQNLGLTLMMEHCTPDATLPLFTHGEGNWNPLITPH